MLGFYTIQLVALNRWRVWLSSILYSWCDVRGAVNSQSADTFEV